MSSYLYTGQTACYDELGREIPCAGSGQDAEDRRGLAWPAPRFARQGTLVTDRLTGLVWLRDAGRCELPMTWREALDFVERLNLEACEGFSDWRLPNRRELRSLVDYQTSRSVLAAGHPFINVFSGWYWTSTTAAITPAHAWYVDLGGGRMFYGGKDQSFMAWPVRGASAVLPATGQDLCYDDAGRPIACIGSGQDGELRLGLAWPEPRFAVEGAIVTDRLTGLRWQRSANTVGGPTTWSGALDFIRGLNSAAAAFRWRLPTINELESLVDARTCRPALPVGHPFVDVRDVYWSATTSL